MIETLPATRIRRTRLRTSASQSGVALVIQRHYVGRSEKQFWVILFSFPPNPVHHRKDLALGVEPRMHTIARALKGCSVKTPHLVVFSLGIHPPEIAQGFDLPDPRFVQPLTIVFRHPKPTISPQLASMGKAVRCLNNRIEEVRADFPDPRYLLKLLDLPILTPQSLQGLKGSLL